MSLVSLKLLPPLLAYYATNGEGKEAVHDRWSGYVTGVLMDAGGYYTKIGQLISVGGVGVAEQYKEGCGRFQEHTGGGDNAVFEGLCERGVVKPLNDDKGTSYKQGTIGVVYQCVIPDGKGGRKGALKVRRGGVEGELWRLDVEVIKRVLGWLNKGAREGVEIQGLLAIEGEMDDRREGKVRRSVERRTAGATSDSK